ncbi:MAG: IS110 family transposase [Chloroflexi bacterium]|nr:IS110 family transposase [Chloroflexota bacterium]
MDVLGIDVGKDFLDCELLTGKPARKKVPNTIRGFEQLAKWLLNRKVKKVHACMEATGGWSEELAFFLYERGHVVSIVNPMQISAFGQSELSRNKTDKVDAGIIARFCQAMKPKAWDPPTPGERRLQHLVRRRRGLIEMRTQELNRLEAPGVDDIRESVTSLIEVLNGQIEVMEAEIRATIAKDDDLRGKRDLIESIPGIGEVTSSTLLAEAPHIENFQKKALAAFVGVHPQLRESGRSKKKSRRTRIGKQAIRPVLFMAAMVALRTNPIVRSFGIRLRERGKTEMQIIVAAMNKLLTLVYGVLKTGRPFDPHWA